MCIRDRIDAWDNLRDTDTPAPHRNFTVDVTIMTEERLTLPNYTVSLVCCGLFSLLVASPVILHSRYHKAGIGISSAQGVDLMPMLETTLLMIYQDHLMVKQKYSL